MGTNGLQEDRLLILEDEPSGGRPVGPQYWDRDEKLAFMDRHEIDISVVSTANPWLDFLASNDALSLAADLNADLEDYCSTSPSLPSSGKEIKRLYGFGLLPLVPSVPITSVVDVISSISSQHPHLKGIIMGTRGIGKGLDDPELEPVWETIERSGLVIFLHPHYGVAEGREWGERDNGHVLPLALGFPMETTIAITRLILAGVLDRYPSLQILLAHSGGALPQLSSRLSSCITHDPVVSGRLQHDARWYLNKLYFDAVNYGTEEMEFVSSVVGRAERYSNDSVAAGQHRGGGDLERAIAERRNGSRRMLWGTDHPFFPPLSSTEKWKSVVENLEAIEDVSAWSKEEKDGVRGGNAVRLFRLGL
ncbi:hypothetical protein FRC02_007087 [Tulasnella sp. 418]|nr:hypothetical protein FRC02_007087 [Tulasnella sp. 418]